MADSIFPADAFELSYDVFVQELSYLQHRLGISSVARCFTIKCDPDRHFRFVKCDKSPSGEIAGWQYEEIGGTGKALIIND